MCTLVIPLSVFFVWIINFVPFLIALCFIYELWLISTIERTELDMYQNETNVTFGRLKNYSEANKNDKTGINRLYDIYYNSLIMYNTREMALLTARGARIAVYALVVTFLLSSNPTDSHKALMNYIRQEVCQEVHG